MKHGSFLFLCSCTFILGLAASSQAENEDGRLEIDDIYTTTIYIKRLQVLVNELTTRQLNSNLSLEKLNALVTLLQQLETTVNSVYLKVQWSIFKIEYERNYSAEEDPMRFEIFKKNWRIVEEHNRRYEMGLETFTIEINQFSDWTDEEINGSFGTGSGPSFGGWPDYGATTADDGAVTTDYGGITVNGRAEQKSIQQNGLDKNDVFASDEADSVTSWLVEFNASSYQDQQLPSSLDWRDRGVLNSASSARTLNQAWAVAAAWSLEAAVFISTHHHVSLSVQQLLDCSRGTDVVSAFHYVIGNGGITTSTTYQPKENAGECRFSHHMRPVYRMSNFKVVKGESDLEKAVTFLGPAVVHVDASHPSFFSYKQGVYHEASCGTGGDYPMLLLGYGTDSNSNMDFWLLKDPWQSSRWGEDGFMKLARNKHNHCGIASWALLPVAERA